jgi:hypothetical protein
VRNRGEGVVSLTVMELDDYTESVQWDIDMGFLRIAFAASSTPAYSR